MDLLSLYQRSSRCGRASGDERRGVGRQKQEWLAKIIGFEGERMEVRYQREERVAVASGLV